MEFQDELAGGTVLVRPALQSPDYLTGVSGWAVKIDGSAEFNNIVIRGGGTSDPVVVGSSTSPQVIIRTSAGNGLIVFPTNRAIEAAAATVGSAVINPGAANERAELQVTGPTVNGAPLGVRLVLGSRPQDATDVARFSVQDRTGATVFFTVDGDQVLATGRPLTAERALTTSTAIQTRVTGEAQPRLVITGDGALNWGPGTAGVDTNLYRAAVGILQTDDTFVVLGEFSPRNLVRGTRPLSSDTQYETRVVGDTNARWFIRSTGETWWGSGAAVQDVNLFRSGAGALATNGDFAVTGVLTAGNIQSGSVAITPTVASQWTANTTVTFPAAFATAPAVLLTCTAGGPAAGGTTELEIIASAVTTTNFAIRIRRDNLTPTTITWLAISTP